MRFTRLAISEYQSQGMKVGEEEMLIAGPITNFSPAFFRVGEVESYAFSLL